MTSGSKHVYNFDFYLNFDGLENNWQRIVDGNNVHVFRFANEKRHNFLQTSKSTIMSNSRTFSIKKASDFLTVTSNQFIISDVKIRISEKLSNLINIINIGINVDRKNEDLGYIYKEFVDYRVSKEDEFTYTAKVDERIDTLIYLADLFRLTMETVQDPVFSQLNVGANLLETIFLTLEISGSYVNVADSSINKNVLERENISNINVFEYSKQLNIFEKDQGLELADPEQVTTISIKSVEFANILVPYTDNQGNNQNLYYVTRTYNLGHGVLYNANITADVQLPSINIPEINVTGGKFITYKYLSSSEPSYTIDDEQAKKENLFLFYLTVDDIESSRLPNKFSKTIYVYRNDFGLYTNDLNWKTSNPL